jgi:hypothetical protein
MATKSLRSQKQFKNRQARRDKADTIHRIGHQHSSNPQKNCQSLYQEDRQVMPESLQWQTTHLKQGRAMEKYHNTYRNSKSKSTKLNSKRLENRK